MLTREQLRAECRKIFDALPDRGETIDGVDDAVLKLNKQAAMAIDLAETVEAYRLAGKCAKRTDGKYCQGEQCPLFIAGCKGGTNGKGVACLFPSEYEAEWIAAYRSGIQAGKEDAV